jgi:hypothetical protein
VNRPPSPAFSDTHMGKIPRTNFFSFSVSGALSLLAGGGWLSSSTLTTGEKKKQLATVGQSEVEDSDFYSLSPSPVSKHTNEERRENIKKEWESTLDSTADER